MRKVQEPTLRKTLTVEPTVKKNLTVATSRIPWRPVIALLAGIVVMSVVVLSGQELKHVPPAAPSFVVLYTFKGAVADGQFPNGLTRDTAGNLYGTTARGFQFGCIDLECGTIFKLTPTGTETLLFRNGGKDSPGPNAGLVLDAASNLYGTFVGHDCPAGYLCGSVFKLDPTGTFTDLHSFSGGADGGDPEAGLIRDGAGNLYGTNVSGAAGSACESVDCGVVFELVRCNSGYDFKVLYTFTGGADGSKPYAELLRDSAGNLYGTTRYGGARPDFSGYGVVFELIRCDSEPSGYQYKVLHSFTGGADGGNPVARLIRDTAGNLYGTTLQGGAKSSACDTTCGVVFKLSPTGTETVLHRFSGGADGGNPYAGLVRDGAGNLYGTTVDGGASGVGVVFKLSPTGTYTVLHSFTGGADGAYPVGPGLIQDLAGNLYGTASEGGVPNISSCSGGCGVVFKLAPN